MTTLSPDDDDLLQRVFAKSGDRRRARSLLHDMSPVQRKRALANERKDRRIAVARLRRLRNLWAWGHHINGADFNGTEKDAQIMADFWNLQELPSRGGPPCKWTIKKREAAMADLRDYYEHQYRLAGIDRPLDAARRAIYVPGIEPAAESLKRPKGKPVRRNHISAALAALDHWRDSERADLAKLVEELYGRLHLGHGDRGTYVEDIRWREVRPNIGDPTHIQSNAGRRGKSRGTIHLNDAERGLLMALHEVSPFTGEHDIVLCNPVAARKGRMEPWSNGQHASFWRRLRKAANIEDDVDWHRLGIRHHHRTQSTIDDDDLHMSRHAAAHAASSRTLPDHYKDAYDRHEARRAVVKRLGDRSAKVCTKCGLPLLPSDLACPMEFCGHPIAGVARPRPQEAQLDAFGLMHASNQASRTTSA